MAEALKRRGWRITLIEPDSAPLSLPERFDDVRRIPSPADVAPPKPNRRMVSHTDVLEWFGYDRAAFVFQRLLLWTKLFDELKPDVIATDHAPCATLAARGRYPVMAVGSACLLPPWSMPSFPRLRSFAQNAPRQEADQTAMLRAVNQALTMTGRAPLSVLPELYRADDVCCATLPLLDAYHAQRPIPTIPTAPPPGNRRASGSDLVVYVTAMPHRVADAIVEGTILSGLPAVLAMPFAGPKLLARAQDAGLDVREAQIGLDELATRTKLAFHAGTFGFAAFMAQLGAPQVALGTDYERNINAALVERAGIAMRIPPLVSRNPRAIADVLREAWESEALTARARTVADELAAVPVPDPYEVTADRLAVLARGRESL